METSITPKIGPVVLFGSGETSSSGRKVFDRILRTLPDAPRLALLETPAGFELNSNRVIGRVAEFLRHNLQNYRPQVEVIPARKQGTAFSPDDPALVAPLLVADLIFMGPGSPTYAIRQLRASLAWHYLLARHRLGATLVFASAATVAVSAFALPVYEIYKAGEELHWKEGLDIFGLYGLPLIFIPHWNNNDGGAELDTSRCFMGQSRFAELAEMLPPEQTILGIDEKTALTIDIQAGECWVGGLGGVTLIHTGHRHRSSSPDLRGTGLTSVAKQCNGHVHQYHSGEAFPLTECSPIKIPSFGEGVPAEVWQRAREVQAQLAVQPQGKPHPDSPPAEVLELVNARQVARTNKDWAKSDALRSQIFAMGWQVLDTPQGPKIEQIE